MSIAAGSILALLGLSRRSLPGIAVGAVGGATDGQDGAARGERISRRGVEIAQAFLINKSARELYDFWRNFENLPRIMSYLDSVTVSDERRSH